MKEKQQIRFAITNKCCNLKYLVENLINVGHLKEFIKSLPNKQHNVQQTPTSTNTIVNPIDTRLVMNVIHGGAVDSTWAQKSEVKKNICAASIPAYIGHI